MAINKHVVDELNRIVANNYIPPVDLKFKAKLAIRKAHLQVSPGTTNIGLPPGNANYQAIVNRAIINESNI